MKGLNNLFILVGDARNFVQQLPEGVFDEVFVNFPEPIHAVDSPRLIDASLLSNVRILPGFERLVSAPIFDRFFVFFFVFCFADYAAVEEAGLARHRDRRQVVLGVYCSRFEETFIKSQDE